ncbi:Uncharacterized protein ABJ99_2098 [Pseudomonas syringae pv. cilantro]|uniref:DUF4123 domain-containing protein n=1 Tax=Pseudomonas syringae pv. cilantro TaxID=81035 RepID=A0A0N0GGH5_PSESX|nr:MULTISPECIES: DUF4123 domain-containing protein [Pseudomonas syringae group]KPC33240.1 Uncharacterized protein ABJ99_2098 [Pseudomonas syringae pv. cilantro]
MNQANYLLIDGVLRPDAIKHLYQCAEALEIRPLYLGTRWSAIMTQGPVLVKVPAESSLIREWLESVASRTDASVFSSHASLKTVAEHLCRFLCPSDHLGNSSLLRFADPLVMHYWLSSYSDEHLSRIMGPVDQLWVQPPVHAWQHNPSSLPAPFINAHPQRPWQQNFALLGEPQLHALDECYRWLLEERIHDWLQEEDAHAFANQTEAQISMWLKRAVNSGLEWGLVSEYALATWADICHGWGLDFVYLPQSPYQSWQAKHPELQHLPPELRISALAEYRQKPYKNKGSAA